MSRLFDAARTLLDVAIAHSLNELNDPALDAVLALFRRTVTGQPRRATNPAAYHAERDADLLGWLMGSGRRVAAAREQAEHDLDAQLQALREVRHGRA